MSVLQKWLRSPYRFDGGLFLPEHKSVIARRPIENVPADGILQIPLQVRHDLTTTPLVQPGDRVLRGQRLAAAATPDSLPIHAPTSGEIIAPARVWTAEDGYLPGIVLRPDGHDEPLPPLPLWIEESFLGQLAGAGVMCSRPREPLHRLIQRATAAGAIHLILNAMETEPYLSAQLRLLVEQPGRLLDVSGEIADALGAHRLIIALPYRHRRVIRRLRHEALDRHVEVIPLPNRFPQCHPIVITKAILQQEVPPGGDPLDVGALVLPMETVAAAAGALLDGHPMTHVCLTVAGDVVERPGVYRVPIGTPMRRLADRAGLRGPVRLAISGGLLTGTPLGHNDAVVTANTTALLLLSQTEKQEAVPCIHCGWCVEDCPVGLNPPALMNLEAEDDCRPDDLNRLRVCIDCGLCSYVCPAGLPLAASIRRSRERFLSNAGGSP